MMSPEDELMDSKGMNDVPRICRWCRHSENAHFWQMSERDNASCDLCECRRFEPQDYLDVLSDENPEGI